jgi:hypothetical protein
MKTRLDLHASSAPAGQLNAIVLCEHDALALPPLRSLQGVMSRLPGDLDIHSHVWTFASLQAAPVYEAALRQAADTGLIAVATRGDHDLPAGVRSFLTRALTLRMPHPVALVLFADAIADTPQQPAVAARYLKALAASAGAQFFATHLKKAARSQTSPGTATPSAPTPPTQPKPGSEVRGAADPGGAHRHWGINE